MFCGCCFQNDAQNSFEMPKIGTFNLHASLLPDYRGAALLILPSSTEKKKTGATFFFINEKIDGKYSFARRITYFTRRKCWKSAR